jgi:transposase InsO family protein
LADEYPIRRLCHWLDLAELQRRGEQVNHKRVGRLMQEENLLVQGRRYVRTTWSGHGSGSYPHRVKGVTAQEPNHIGCGDITYIRVQREFVCLAVRMDLYTRGMRGWH